MEGDKVPKYVHGARAQQHVQDVLQSASHWGAVAEINQVHGSIVSIDFRDASTEKPCSINVTLDMVAWRLRDASGNLVIGSGFPVEQMQKNLQRLLGARLIKLTLNIQYGENLALQFSTGDRLETFDCCNTYPYNGDGLADCQDGLATAYVAWVIRPAFGEYLVCVPGGEIYVEVSE